MTLTSSTPGSQLRRTTFHQAGATVTLTTDSVPAWDDATNTLYAYQRRTGPPARWRVEVILDPSAADAPGVDLASASTVEVGPRTHALRWSYGTGDMFWISEHQTLVGVDHRALITARCATDTGARHWAARLVRQAMTAQLLDSGAIYAHAAAFIHRGRGVLIAGHRHRGKTTTLLAALHYLAGDYLTNDRLLLQTNDDLVVGYPWPMHLRAGVGTLSALPHLDDLVPAEARDLMPDEKWTYSAKVAIEPPDFPRLLAPSATIASSATLRLMLWPDLHLDRHDIAVERVAIGEVHAELLRTQMFMVDPGRAVSSHINHWLLPPPSDEITADNRHTIAAALTRVPCYRIRAGADPKALADAVRQLLDDTADTS